MLGSRREKVMPIPSDTTTKQENQVDCDIHAYFLLYILFSTNDTTLIYICRAFDAIWNGIMRVSIAFDHHTYLYILYMVYSIYTITIPLLLSYIFVYQWITWTTFSIHGYVECRYTMNTKCIALFKNVQKWLICKDILLTFSGTKNKRVDRMMPKQDRETRCRISIL